MPTEASSDLRSRLAAGDKAALSEATALLYRELRSTARSVMRQERRNHTLQPTGLVHEVLLRLRSSCDLHVDSDDHFLNLARGVMRHVLKDHAKARGAQKRQAAAEPPQPPSQSAPETLVDLRYALGRLREEDPDAAAAVRLRHLLGHSWQEVSDLMGITISQARYLEQQGVQWLRKRGLSPGY